MDYYITDGLKQEKNEWSKKALRLNVLWISLPIPKLILLYATATAFFLLTICHSVVSLYSYKSCICQLHNLFSCACITHVHSEFRRYTALGKYLEIEGGGWERVETFTELNHMRCRL